MLKADLNVNGVHAIDWSVIGGLPPHKVFLWDSEGNYLDCEFPNPVHGHFLGASNLRGRNISEVLTTNNFDVLLWAISQALTNHCPLILRLDMARATVRFHSLVRLLPMNEFVIGWVNDFPALLPGRHGQKRNQIARGTISKFLTAREREIALLVTQHQSNQQIAERLQISSRTVKFHLSHVLDKLQLTTRVQIQAILPLLH